MYKTSKSVRPDYILTLIIFFLVSLSVVILNSTASSLFPQYYLYLVLGVIAFTFFSRLDFKILAFFSKHLYVLSIIFLILPLIIGQVTRGVVRWIPIGALSLQPAEIVRPFLLVFFASYLTSGQIDTRKLIRALGLLLIPVVLIMVQPSLGVSVMTGIGFLGVLLATGLKRKYYVYGVALMAALLPVVWFIMAPYQRDRVFGFLNPGEDPLGAGYNSIQSTISVGSGGLFGRGLGKGVQTQLAFLPERHTDFVFASISEELGFVGVFVLLALTAFLLFRLINIMENTKGRVTRAFVAGLFLTFLVQIFVHVGMNLGLLPITGLPYPLVSAGGSSLLATMAGLGMAISARRQSAA